ncbi:MAG TPA: hypothetical protein VFD04_14740 [Actinomycetes bacterium]|jgi:hypothetical protein|nr:hypothetical protein [Actinomycetes bacterium]
MQPRAPRHLAERRSPLDFLPQSLVAVIVLIPLLIMGTVLAKLPDHPGSGSAAGQASDPTSAPPREGSAGNLVTNWSFERDLSGWQVLGPADASRAPQGRTSGSCAAVRARGPGPGRIGLALPDVVRVANPGDRYVLKAWVRSTSPGVRVTALLSGSGGAKPERSQTTTTTLPGVAWRVVIVAHTMTARIGLGVQIIADGVPAGDALLVDEVMVRRG